jgi:predicted nucleotide-binding protein (sugar kinase/HSP70/actin superfamily)
MKPSTLSNIGTKVEEDLAKLEIYTVEDFLQYSIYEIYFKMQCINKKWRNKMLVYALFGAVNNVNCIMLSNAEKNHINQEYKKYINLANE